MKMARAAQLSLGLTRAEIDLVRKVLKREPNDLEWSILDAEWSEHCSYKSSKQLLKLFSSKGKNVLIGPGYDAGVIDLGQGYVITLHIESHNHPSAIDPYGGAATGIGGVLRDILSMGSRPIALIDLLRFGSIDKSSHSRWLFKNVVRGIADYGNCISSEDLIYFTNSSLFHVANAKTFYDEFSSSGKLLPEFDGHGLTITRPKVDLRVLSFDFEDKEARFCKVSRVYKASVSRLLRIQTTLGRTISVTPDHPMFVLENSVLRTKQARDLRPGDSLPVVCDFPFSRQPISQAHEIDLIEELSRRGLVEGVTVSCEKPRLIEVKKILAPLFRKAGVTAGQMSHFFSNNYIPLKTYLSIEALGGCPLERRNLLLYSGRGRVNRVPAVLKVDSSFSRLIGYFLAEGCRHEETGNHGRRKTSRLIWTFRRDETEYIEDLCETLRAIGVRYSRRHTHTNTVQVKVSSRILGLLFKDVLSCGSDSYSMRIPNLFYGLSRELMLDVLKGILRGDASIKTSSKSSAITLNYASSSATLFQQVLLLLQSMGCMPRTEVAWHKSTVPLYVLEINGRKRLSSLKDLLPRSVSSKAGRRISQYKQPSAEHPRFSLYEKLATVKVTDLEELTGNFSVYNFEVEGTHNYVTTGGIVTHNCVGVPTVAGEIEFDESFERNCLVDVACIGLGRRNELTLGEARVAGDLLVLIGGSTGRDGIRGATFASKNLAEDAESERSSVQVPDPFMKKLLLDALLEAVQTGSIRGMKDLGGGGLSTALSEIGAKGNAGIDVELTRVALRESDMTPIEIMTSESQERMLLVLPPSKAERTLSILRKYGITYSIIGKVTRDRRLTVRYRGKVVASLPIEFVANAPPIPRRAKHSYLKTKIEKPIQPSNLSKVLLSLLASPNIASKRWVYQQYDHEVGIRTVIKPGRADAAVLRLPNGKYLAVKGDGNSKISSLDPYNGAAGCVSEACRNIIAVGAEPIAVVDHLQVGDPADPEVYWSFKEMVKGMADYCRAVGLPVVGGKVSFYNEDALTKQAIKPSPIALVIGLVQDKEQIMSPSFKNEDDAIFMIGETESELGGSEYYEQIPFTGGDPPKVRPSKEEATNASILELIRDRRVTAVHDCSKGGLAVALAEMCMAGDIGAEVKLDNPKGMRSDELLFSETHGRFLISVNPHLIDDVRKVLTTSGVFHAIIGRIGGKRITVKDYSDRIIDLTVDQASLAWEGSLPKMMD
jgi:phosphoribosylformylglycinamidine synthase